MIKLSNFNELGIAITWTIIDIGFKGNDIFSGQLSADDIINYAMETLEKDNYPETVAELASESVESTEQIADYIKKLSGEENVNTNCEIEKWKVCYVYQCVKVKHENYIDGLCELGDIWLKIGLPHDNPHIYQGVNNGISPKEYYTQKNYDELFEAHHKWIKSRLEMYRNTP